MRKYQSLAGLLLVDRLLALFGYLSPNRGVIDLSVAHLISLPDLLKLLVVEAYFDVHNADVGHGLQAQMEEFIKFWIPGLYIVPAVFPHIKLVLVVLGRRIPLLERRIHSRRVPYIPKLQSQRKGLPSAVHLKDLSRALPHDVDLFVDFLAEVGMDALGVVFLKLPEGYGSQIEINMLQTRFILVDQPQGYFCSAEEIVTQRAEILGSGWSVYRCGGDDRSGITPTSLSAH